MGLRSSFHFHFDLPFLLSDSRASIGWGSGSSWVAWGGNGFLLCNQFQTIFSTDKLSQFFFSRDPEILWWECTIDQKSPFSGAELEILLWHKIWVLIARWYTLGNIWEWLIFQSFSKVKSLRSGAFYLVNGICTFVGFRENCKRSPTKLYPVRSLW